MLLTREHRFSDQHVIRFSVSTDKTGWKVLEEQDGKVIFAISYNDWHRVERRLRQFEAKIAAAAAKKTPG